MLAQQCTNTATFLYILWQYWLHICTLLCCKPDLPTLTDNMLPTVIRRWTTMIQSSTILQHWTNAGTTFQFYVERLYEQQSLNNLDYDSNIKLRVIKWNQIVFYDWSNYNNVTVPYEVNNALWVLWAINQTSFYNISNNSEK